MRTKCESINKMMHRVWKNYVYPYRLAYFLGGIILLLILFGELYYDFLVTYRAGINFWYALFEGHPLSFYSRVAEIGGGTPNREALSGAAYDFTIYFFFAVWNFPAWLYERFAGIPAESNLLCLMWGKMMLPVLALLTARGMKRILEFVVRDEEDTAEMLFAYSFSGILALACYFLGQYDIIGVLFAVWGVYYFLKGDYRRFYLFFSVAITCKYFAILLFLCLVLLHEKRILYIIRNVAGGCWLVIAEKLLFSLDNSGEVVGTDLLSTRVSYLIHLKMEMGVDNAAVFLVLCILIWAYCYQQKREESYAFYYKVVNIAFCINMVFILFTGSTPYWIVLVVPYMILLFYCKGSDRKLNLLLETIGVGCYIIWWYGRHIYLFDSGNCEGMLFYYLLGEPGYIGGGLAGILGELMGDGGRLSSVTILLRTVFYGCMLAILLLNFPGKGCTVFQREKETGIRGTLIFREICMAGVLVLPLLFYIVQVVCGDQIAGMQTQNEILQTIVTQMGH